MRFTIAPLGRCWNKEADRSFLVVQERCCHILDWLHVEEEFDPNRLSRGMIVAHETSNPVIVDLNSPLETPIGERENKRAAIYDKLERVRSVAKLQQREIKI